MAKEKLAWFIIRIGVTFAFLYAALAGFRDPQSWVGWFPRFARDAVPELLLLKIWGAFEIVIGLWILSGKKIFWPSVVASLSLAGLIVFNLSEMDVIFRDVAVLAATAALAVQNFPAATADRRAGAA